MQSADPFPAEPVPPDEEDPDQPLEPLDPEPVSQTSEPPEPVIPDPLELLEDPPVPQPIPLPAPLRLLLPTPLKPLEPGTVEPALSHALLLRPVQPSRRRMLDSVDTSVGEPEPESPAEGPLDPELSPLESTVPATAEDSATGISGNQSEEPKDLGVPGMQSVEPFPVPEALEPLPPGPLTEPVFAEPVELSLPDPLEFDEPVEPCSQVSVLAGEEPKIPRNFSSAEEP